MISTEHREYVQRQNDRRLIFDAVCREKAKRLGKSYCGSATVQEIAEYCRRRNINRQTQT